MYFTIIKDKLSNKTQLELDCYIKKYIKCRYFIKNYIFNVNLVNQHINMIIWINVNVSIKLLLYTNTSLNISMFFYLVICVANWIYNGFKCLNVFLCNQRC